MTDEETALCGNGEADTTPAAPNARNDDIARTITDFRRCRTVDHLFVPRARNPRSVRSLDRKESSQPGPEVPSGEPRRRSSSSQASAIARLAGVECRPRTRFMLGTYECVAEHQSDPTRSGTNPLGCAVLPHRFCER